jgi:hypothetical protein
MGNYMMVNELKMSIWSEAILNNFLTIQKNACIKKHKQNVNPYFNLKSPSLYIWYICVIIFNYGCLLIQAHNLNVIKNLAYCWFYGMLILYINSVSLSVRPFVSDKCEQNPDDRVQLSLLPLSLVRSHNQTNFVAGSLGGLLAVKTFSSCSPLLFTSLLPLSLARSHNQTSFVVGIAFFSPLCFGWVGGRAKDLDRDPWTRPMKKRVVRVGKVNPVNYPMSGRAGGAEETKGGTGGQQTGPHLTLMWCLFSFLLFIFSLLITTKVNKLFYSSHSLHLDD